MKVAWIMVNTKRTWDYIPKPETTMIRLVTFTIISATKKPALNTQLEKPIRLYNWLNNPNQYPRSKDFSEFRTHDSSSLIKILSTFSEEKISEDFKEVFKKCRERRNALMHSYNGNLKLEANELLKDILQTNLELLSKPWLDIRKEYIGNDEEFALTPSSEFEIGQLLKEFELYSISCPTQNLILILEFRKEQDFTIAKLALI